MDWSFVISTFALVFVAEIGDKTQLATISLAASSRRPGSIAAGAICALAAGTLLAVAAGQRLPDMMPLSLIRRVAGALFIANGVWMLLRGS
jgi:putative Ca2+/H+ antiporter (TMEM165/GDT1 family)